MAEWHEKESETCYRGGYHPERDGGSRLWPRYTCSPAGRFGDGDAERDSHCHGEANMDINADRNPYLHADHNTNIYCDANADRNADPYGHAHRDADVYRYCN